MKIPFILASLLLVSVGVQASSPSCHDLFSNEPLTRLSNVIELHKRLDDPVPMIQSLLRHSSDLKPTQYFGSGFSSTVWKVESSQGPLALKILFENTEGLTNPFDLKWVAIQEALANEGIAPRVRGLLHQKELKVFVEKHKAFFKSKGMNTSDIAVGILMDVSNAVTLKSNLEKQTQFSANEDASFRRDIEHHLKVIEELGVDPRDPDAAILTRADGSKFLQMIDISGYERGKMNRENYEEYLNFLLNPGASGLELRME